MTVLDRVFATSMLAVLALVPIFFVPVTWISLLQGKMLLLATLALVAVVVFLVRACVLKEIRLPRHPILIAGLLLPVSYAVSAVAGQGGVPSLVGSGLEPDTLAAIILSYAVLLLAASAFPRRTTGAVRAFFFAGACLVLFQIAHLFFPDALSLGGLFAGATGNLIGTWHDLAIVLGVLVLLASIGVSGSLLPAMRLLVGAVAALSLAMLVIVNMKDVWIVLGVFALIALGATFVRAWRVGDISHATKREWPLMLVLFICIVCSLGGTFLHDRFPEKIRITSVEVRPSWQGTFFVAQQSLEQPGRILIGTGPNTFSTQWNLFKPVDVNKTPFWNADFGSGVGTIPTSLATLGIAGAIAWGIFLLAVLWSAVQFLRREIVPAAPQSFARSVSYAALFLTTFLVMYTPTVTIVALTFIFLGLLVAALGEPRVYPLGFRGMGLVHSLALFAGTLITGAAAISVILIILSDLSINRASLSFKAPADAARAGALIQEALSIAPYNDRAHRAAVELGIVELQALIAAGKTDDAAKKQLQDTLSVTIAHALSAVSINSRNYQNWFTLASVYGDLAGQNVKGAYESARDAYLRSLESNPTNPLPLLRLAQLELLQKNTAAAHQRLDQAIKMKPDFAAAFYLDSQINASAQKYDLAIQEAAQAVRLVPDDALGWFNLGLIAYAAKQYDNARQAFEHAVGIQNTYANALYFLGHSYYQLGQKDKALAAFREVQKLNPDNAELKTIVDDLAAGRPLKIATSTQTR